MRRATVVAGALLGGIAVSFLAGFQFGSPHRDAAGEPYDDPPAPTTAQRIVNHCGKLLVTQDGDPVTVEIPLVPPPLDERTLSSTAPEPPVEGELPPIAVPAHPPYAKAWAETC